MAKRISNDTEYWQLKDDYTKSLSSIDAETDKKKRKELQKEAADVSKALEAYEKKKTKETLSLVKKEAKLSKIRSKTKADKKIFFDISPIESRYYDFSALSEKERNRLSVKKESLIEMMKKGMYVKLRDDSGLYQVKKMPERMDDMTFISTAKYGDVTIQDTALIIERYYYESELASTGHKVM